MTKIKLCGISRLEDISAVNELKPEYIGFVFAKNSKRFVSPSMAAQLKEKLLDSIQAVGVFVNEPVENVAKLLKENTIDVAQLHGSEDHDYIMKLRNLINKPIIKAFRINDIANMECCSADYVLIDSGAGSGKTFKWNLIKNLKRPFFLAGGLDAQNVNDAVNEIHPFAVDVSSGIESNGVKDYTKMAKFVAAVRKEERL
ncbi:MAG: phosphoribosylanthranilate isomerase [Clostridiales bacterium]|nr:phosphoribosylanthranilate isomerase [Clostridiales bacterium]